MSRPILLHCITSLALGGAEVLLRNTIKGLPGYEHVVCYLHPPDTLAPDLADYKLYDLQHRGWKDLFRTVRRLKHIIQAHRPALIHAHLFDATLMSRFARPAGIPFYFTIHNILSRDAFQVNRLSLLAEKMTYKKDQTIISVSQAALKDYGEWVGIKGPAHVLYNYVHEKYFDLRYDPPGEVLDGFRLIAVGNLRRQKNYGSLLEALTLVGDIPVSLDIYGGGELQTELQQVIRDKKVNARLMGRVPDIVSVLGDYHAYIMPSLFEGFGIAPMEAMAAGMPVLLSDIPVFRELAADLPLFFDPSDLASIAGAIREAYTDWARFRESGTKCRDLVRWRASREMYFENLKSIY